MLFRVKVSFSQVVRENAFSKLQLLWLSLLCIRLGSWNQWQSQKFLATIFTMSVFSRLAVQSSEDYQQLYQAMSHLHSLSVKVSIVQLHIPRTFSIIEMFVARENRCRNVSKLFKF